MSTRVLEDYLIEAEDNGSEVEYDYDPEYDSVLRGVWVNGEYVENGDYEDEVSDAYWLDDSYRVAERYLY